MKTTIELDAADIKRLVAKEFQVKEDKVLVYLQKVYKGYGMGEHQDHEICVKVLK